MYLCRRRISSLILKLSEYSENSKILFFTRVSNWLAATSEASAKQRRAATAVAFFWDVRRHRRTLRQSPHAATNRSCFADASSHSSRRTPHPSAVAARRTPRQLPHAATFRSRFADAKLAATAVAARRNNPQPLRRRTASSHSSRRTPHPSAVAARRNNPQPQCSILIAFFYICKATPASECKTRSGPRVCGAAFIFKIIIIK
jgi:hypothetical protein